MGTLAPTDMFAAAPGSIVAEHLKRAGSMPYNAQAALLRAPPGGEPASLLMQLALRRAQEGDTVLFITAVDKAQMHDSPPRLPDVGVPDESVDASAASRILIRYCPTFALARLLLCSVHLLDPPPALIIVDEVVAMCGAPPTAGAFAEFSALLRSALAHLERVRGRPCCVVASDSTSGAGVAPPSGVSQSPSPARHLTAPLNGCFPLQLAVHATTDGGYRLTVESVYGQPDEGHLAIDYTVTHSGIRVDACQCG